MQHLGTGLSVENLCLACNLTYNQLCELAQEHMDLYHELKKWYKRFDFEVKKEAIADACETLNKAGVNYTLKVEPTTFEDKSLESKDKSKTSNKKSKKKVETK